MKELNITIVGKTPLLCSRFTDAEQMAASNSTRSSIASNSRSPQEIAESKLYTDDDGMIGIPQPNLFRCIIDAGKYFKAGRRTITTQKSSLIPGCVAVDPIFIQLQHEQAWKVDSRPVRIPATGGRIIAHRPCFDDWSLTFNVELDEDIISESLFRDIVDAAGSRVGLGDFRPDNKGPFGRFVVTNWKIAAEAID